MRQRQMAKARNGRSAILVIYRQTLDVAAGRVDLRWGRYGWWLQLLTQCLPFSNFQGHIPHQK